MSTTIWDYVNSICDKKKIEYDDKIFNGYVTCLHFSQDNNTIQYSEEINKLLFLLPNKAVYSYFYDKIPKGKRWIKWPKKSKDKNNKELQKFKDDNNLSSEEIKKYEQFF